MIERPCHLEQDRANLTELWLDHRIATSVEIYPTIWRLRLLLTSRVWKPILDTRIWETEGGQIAAFGMLWRRQRQSPYLVLDYFIHPMMVAAKLNEGILRWGTQRAQTIAKDQQISLTLFTSSRYDAVHSEQSLKKFGFEQRPSRGQEYNLYYARSLDTGLTEPALLSGYKARLLRGNDNLEAYRSIYEFAAVNPQYQKELLASDEYHHRIVSDPEGNFVAYCEYSFCRAEWQRSGHRLGWIDYIGVRPANQRLGLGSALLNSSLQHLKSQGTEMAMLVTVSTNTPAIGLYHQAGFKPINVPEPPNFQIQISQK